MFPHFHHHTKQEHGLRPEQKSAQKRPLLTFPEKLIKFQTWIRSGLQIRWWGIRTSLCLFATHWAGLMIPAWPGFVSQVRAFCFLAHPVGSRRSSAPALQRRLLASQRTPFNLFSASLPPSTLCQARPLPTYATPRTNTRGVIQPDGLRVCDAHE